VLHGDHRGVDAAPRLPEPGLVEHGLRDVQGGAEAEEGAIRIHDGDQGPVNLGTT
jgi:hypothetical protein